MLMHHRDGSAASCAQPGDIIVEDANERTGTRRVLLVVTGPAPTCSFADLPQGGHTVHLLYPALETRYTGETGFCISRETIVKCGAEIGARILAVQGLPSNMYEAGVKLRNWPELYSFASGLFQKPNDPRLAELFVTLMSEWYPHGTNDTDVIVSAIYTAIFTRQVRG